MTSSWNIISMVFHPITMDTTRSGLSSLEPGCQDSLLENFSKMLDMTLSSWKLWTGLVGDCKLTGKSLEGKEKIFAIVNATAPSVEACRVISQTSPCYQVTK